MKWEHKLVEISFRNYNSYVYQDTFLQLRLYDELAKVFMQRNNTLALNFEVHDIFQEMVENCNSNFFSGRDIAFQDLSQNDVQLHKMNCAFKYFSAKNVFILLQEFHKSWFSKALIQIFAITHTISILISIFERFPTENLVSLVLRIILDLEFRIMR